MKGLLTNRWFGVLLRLVIGAWFVVFSLDKILAPQGFADVIDNYRILPKNLVNLVAVTLPWIELTAGICLVAGVFTRSAALLTGVLLIIFLVAVISALSRGLNITCGCRGVGDYHKVAWDLVWRDGLGLLACIQILFSSRDTDIPASLLFDRRKQVSA